MAFNVITPVNLGRGELDVSPTLTLVYTCPAATRALVKTIDIANTTASAAAVTVHIVPAGGAAGVDNMLVPDVTIASKAMFQWAGVQVLNEGDTIEATADIAGVTIHISGGEAV